MFVFKCNQSSQCSYFLEDGVNRSRVSIRDLQRANMYLCGTQNGSYGHGTATPARLCFFCSCFQMTSFEVSPDASTLQHERTELRKDHFYLYSWQRVAIDGRPLCIILSPLVQNTRVELEQDHDVQDSVSSCSLACAMDPNVPAVWQEARSTFQIKSLIYFSQVIS